jgi:ATP-dependent RNA helicase DHX57
MPTIIPESDVHGVLQQLATIGFKVAQARQAIEFLSKPSPFTQSLLNSLSPLEACIEYRRWLL